MLAHCHGSQGHFNDKKPLFMLLLTLVNLLIQLQSGAKVCFVPQLSTMQYIKQINQSNTQCTSIKSKEVSIY